MELWIVAIRYLKYCWYGVKQQTNKQFVLVLIGIVSMSNHNIVWYPGIFKCILKLCCALLSEALLFVSKHCIAEFLWPLQTMN